MEATIGPKASGPARRRRAIEAAAARRTFRLLLRNLGGGALELVEPGGGRTFGSAGAELRARIQIHDPTAYAWALRGSAGLGEGYFEGLWDVDDLVAAIRIAARNLAPFDRLRGRIRLVAGTAQRLASLVPRNTRAGARRHIAAHYDLGNHLFDSFLDRRLVYSCAYFPRADATIDEAQEAKLERICDRLDLRPEHHLLEVGTGWGALAIHAAREHGCRVTTATISREQHAYATERVRELGLDSKVSVVREDYRDLEGRYDRLVSVEMIEAVGWQYFEEFFRRCSALLRDDGLMVLQAIVIDDRLYDAEKAARSFANKHVFPGGCLPSQRLIADLTAEVTDMRAVWMDDISAHYARTLELWRGRFEGAWAGLRERGYDERFRRLWRFYLASSEAGFRERRIRDLQLALAKPGWRGDDLAAAPAARAGRADAMGGAGLEPATFAL